MSWPGRIRTSNLSVNPAPKIPYLNKGHGTAVCKPTVGRRAGRSGNRFVAQGHSVRLEEVG